MIEQGVLDLSGYSVIELYAAGRRFVDDYDADDAVDQYVELHPGADPLQVRQDLDAALKN